MIEVEDRRLPLLQYEQDIMIDTFIDDVLFITAKGLGLERIFFNHLHLYSVPSFTVLVLNTTPDDEHFYLERLRKLNPGCPPKLITADVLSRNRTLIYRSGGVQFVTSRILMVDLLTDKVPFDCVIGILVFRAHELLFGFQESFILRLFREKRPHGFVKAFTDSCVQITSEGLGQLQRLVNLLYLKRVVVLPRFYAPVKECLDVDQQKFVQTVIQLNNTQRKVQANLRDIIGTCVRELKQCTKGVNTETESEILAPSATLRPTKLELDLRRRDAVLTDRQQRLVSDLRTLRTLFHKVEDLDPSNAFQFLKCIRNDKKVLENNSGWLFTQSAANLFANIDTLCSAKDEFGNKTISVPPKWSTFCSTLDEIVSEMPPEDSESPVLVLVSNEYLSRQLIDLVKFGLRRYTWMLTRSLEQLSRRESLGNAPPIKPLWNPTMVAHYDQQLFEKDRQDLRSLVQTAQKEVARENRKRGKKMLLEKEDGPKQARLDQFGILPTTTGGETEQHTGNNLTKAFTKRSPKNKILTMYDKLPLAKETVPEGMLPEDPFTSFYEHEKAEENNNNEGGERRNELEINDSGNGDDVEIDMQNEFNVDERVPVRNYCCIEPGTSAEPAKTADNEDKTLQLPEDEQNTLNGSSLANSSSSTSFVSTIHSLLVFLEQSNSNNCYRLINCLETMRPKHLIMYSSDLASTRAIEVFKAVNKDHQMTVHSFVCALSSEEERFLSSIQRETDAIEMLIREQGVLMVPREFDVSRDSVSQLRRLTMNRTDSRKWTATSTQKIIDEEFEEQLRPLVIVDMREFNSELPITLYRRGIDLHAATLEVGDYILAPQICVERKSLDDLAQSLLNGRLFKQIEQMQRHYNKCILLIECNERDGKSQRSIRFGMFQGEHSKRARELRTLFTLLIRTYPKLHIFWCASPAHSAEFFEELKLDQPNPLVDEAMKKRRGGGAEPTEAEEEQNEVEEDTGDGQRRNDEDKEHTVQDE
ncbi:hypothetical protein niasHT_007342 [Heterodera trifolii]|uniref:DNA repair endonuclease XPF n=1 Tax=Heterodera trifolii TaxID=157864 RepID=A0ABD2LLD4_9BILA